MPDKKLQELCERIRKERDPEQLSASIEELIARLAKEQDAIKGRSKANLIDYHAKLPY